MAKPQTEKKLRKKKKDGINIFKDDCLKIVSRGIDLEELFDKLEKLLEYSLSQSFNRRELISQIRLLDSEEFARVILFCLDSFDSIDIVEFLENAEIDQQLVAKIRFIIAKFGFKYNQLIAADVNPFGWSNVRYSLIEKLDNIYLLDFKVYLYNGEKVQIQDDLESMIELASYIVEGVSKINGKTKIDQEPINKLLELTSQLLNEELS